MLSRVGSHWESRGVRSSGSTPAISMRGWSAALIDTACGFASVTAVESRVLAAHFSVNCLRPAVEKRFVARARVSKPGNSQVFTCCGPFAETDGQERLVATGEAILSEPAKADIVLYVCSWARSSSAVDTYSTPDCADTDPGKGWPDGVATAAGARPERARCAAC